MPPPQFSGTALHDPLDTQAHAPPTLLQGLPQLSTPLVVVSQAGFGALQDPLDTQAHAPPTLVQWVPQLSTP